jgi:hypothetical protein
MIDRFLGAKACRGYFIDHYLLRDAVASAIGGDAFDWREAVVRREVDDGETRAGF